MKPMQQWQLIVGFLRNVNRTVSGYGCERLTYIKYSNYFLVNNYLHDRKMRINKNDQ